MSKIDDLEVLRQYLSEEELKEIAKNVAYETFKSSIGSYNSANRKSNYEWYLKYGALEAVKDHIKEFDAQFLAEDLQNKMRKLIKSLTWYNVPDGYKTIAKEYIQNNRNLIDDKMEGFMRDFVNSKEYPSAHSTFADTVGDSLGDMLYTMLEEKFKKDK